MDEKNAILKPPTALIDCCILASWIHFDPDQPRQVKSRDDIFNAVFKRFSEGCYPNGVDVSLSSAKGSETWGKIYQEWFTNFNIPNADYQVVIGTQIAKLISMNIIMRDNFEDGFYKLVSPLSQDIIDNIKTTTLLVPQLGIDIPELRLG
tara:strand:- start:607 stop:1056 length:450 start_codon:yes stop_codon:yes gene_type:complete